MPDENISAPASTDVTGAPTLPTVAAPVDGAVSPATPASDSTTPVNTPVVEPDVPVAEPNNDESPIVNPAAAAAPQVSDVNTTQVLTPSEMAVEVARKINDSHNVLVALSSDPSVDEMAAAIGLSLYLDRLGKRATAIYSGATPNALEFLKPEETFEPSVDTLQDFVIALNKEKADHLRYKLDGDYVKIYITPYRSKIAEEDLTFTYGDYNVDLVLALDVANGVDLDAALREHGRIMHDAVIVNITTSNPGKLGEIEWSDKNASSVSEMIARLLYSIKGDMKIEKEEATAFLTGIVAATNRFSNNRTTPETMQMASRLMESGANQQLVSKNITPDIDNEMVGMLSMNTKSTKKVEEDPTKLNIGHDGEENVDESKVVSAVVTEKPSTLLDDLKAAEATLAMTGAETTPEKKEEPLKIDSSEMGDVSEAETAPVTETAPTVEAAPEMEAAPATEAAPEMEAAPADEIAAIDVDASKTDNTPEVEKISESEDTLGNEKAPEAEDASLETEKTPEAEEVSEANAPLNLDNAPGVTEKKIEDGEDASAENNDEKGFLAESKEKVIQPLADADASSIGEGDEDKYGHMLEDALKGVENELASVDAATIASSEAQDAAAAANLTGETVADGSSASNGDTAMGGNPAAMGAPAVPSNPEINGVPEINYMPMPGDAMLPPPPTPPIDMSVPAPVDSGMMGGGLPPVEPIAPATPAEESAPQPLGAQPAMQDQVYKPQAADPGAFKIPGM